MLDGLVAGDEIGIDKIENFMGTNIPIKSEAGTYHIGKIGETPRFASENGAVILLNQ